MGEWCFPNGRNANLHLLSPCRLCRRSQKKPPPFPHTQLQHSNHSNSFSNSSNHNFTQFRNQFAVSLQFQQTYFIFSLILVGVKSSHPSKSLNNDPLNHNHQINKTILNNQLIIKFIFTNNSNHNSSFRYSPSELNFCLLDFWNWC